MQRLPGAVVQQDNAQSLTARVLQDCLYSGDLLPDSQICLQSSLSGTIWDRRVGHPTSLNKLEARVRQIWNEMSQDIIQNLYASMPDRIASCICAGGGSTGY
ncbi:transposable element Tcb1 transposase [Trichonephila clavipes]|nr:transposable element Tcb1 transposase [Trichonephila clavipes]